MTINELEPLVAQYRAGLEAEMAILRQLDAVARDEREATREAALSRLPPILEARDRLMAALVNIEHGLKPVRHELAAARHQLADLPEFRELMVRHREAADMANAILATDHHSLDALQEAELARRTAAQALEQGESTLAAYRRVVSPSVSSPTLLNRRG